MTAKRVWEGGDQLRRQLVPIDTLSPFDANPRRGDVGLLQESLRRFGQTRPILVDGDRIIAGHHIVLAAQAEGWTHIAVSRHQFASEQEARAFLLADNRTHDRGGYDDRQLADLLRDLDGDDLTGIGYDDGDIKALIERLAVDEDEQFGRLGAGMKDHVQMAFVVPADGVDLVNDMVARVSSESGDTSPGSRGRALVTVARRLVNGSS